jgi:predicted nucleic acid-binding Zn ribbon protein
MAKGTQFKQDRFEESVLTQTDKKVLKTCLVCSRKFLGWFSEKYCSEECRLEGRRVKDRNRQRKGRKILERRQGVLSQELGELGLGDRSYPMYNHEPVPTMYANPSLYHARDGKRHVTSYYHLVRDIAKLNGGNGWWKVLAGLAPKEE